MAGHLSCCPAEWKRWVGLCVAACVPVPVLLHVLMVCVCCQQLQRKAPAYLAPWRASPRVFRSSKSGLKPNAGSGGVACAPLQTLSEEESMLQTMGTCSVCSVPGPPAAGQLCRQPSCPALLAAEHCSPCAAAQKCFSWQEKVMLFVTAHPSRVPPATEQLSLHT